MSGVNPFFYSAGKPDFSLLLIKQTRYWRHYQVTFPVASTDHFPGGETARGDYYEPVTGHKAPLLIQIHGWGNRSVMPFHWMLPGFLRKGLACFILYQPFHSSRLPAQMKSRLNSFTPDEWMTSYKVAVIDVRSVIDWAEQNERIDCTRITVMGISLGGFVASMAMGVDPRIEAGIFIVHGGNTGKMMQTNRLSLLRKSLRFPTAQYQDNQHNYYSYLREVAEKGFENVVPAHQFYHIDPLTYAPMLTNRPILMVNGLYDEVIPISTSREFRASCGNCQMISFPATHSTIWVWYSFIMHRINKFMENPSLS